MRELRAGILGATGAVGQKFIELLADHPWFKVTALVASQRSVGSRYGEVVNWIGTADIPDPVASMEVMPLSSDLPCDFVFSGLHASIADHAEPQLAQAGYPVISNARSFRMDKHVPLLIPEVNPDHIALIHHQDWQSDGYIVTNPNCSTVGLTCALKPLHDKFGIKAVHVTTMQALSGAGYPGVSSLDALSNVVPYIGGEEDKLVNEPNKLLGSLVGDQLQEASIVISAHCNRVPVLEGHLECVSVQLDSDTTPIGVRHALESYQSPIVDLNLPSMPVKFLNVFDEEHFPQPRRHLNLGNGMTVSIGRIRPCEVLDYKFVVLSHNTVRGAAGGAILNAELLMKHGFLGSR